MAKDYAKAFYNSTAWAKSRRAYILSRMLIDGGLCEECHTAQGYIVHHKVFLNENNIKNAEISLNFDNFEYVCKQCHDRFEGHGIGRKPAGLLVKFDADGNPISLRNIDNPEQ